MSDLADQIDPTLPLERVASDLDAKLDRQTYTLEQLTKWKEQADHWKREAEHWKAHVDRLEEHALKQIKEAVRNRQIIALLLGRVPAPVAENWRFSRDELNAAPIRHLRIGDLPDGGAFVEL